MSATEAPFESGASFFMLQLPMTKKRKIYETGEHMQGERLAQEKLVRWCSGKNAWGNVTAIAMPRLAGFDCILIDEKECVVAIVEIKVRASASNKFSEYLISLRKILELKAHASAMNTSGILLVQFTDCTMLLNVAKVDLSLLKIMEGGRTDRGDPLDIEPCFLIPMSMFTRID